MPLQLQSFKMGAGQGIVTQSVNHICSLHAVITTIEDYYLKGLVPNVEKSTNLYHWQSCEYVHMS
jgi:hypothetical protein